LIFCFVSSAHAKLYKKCVAYLQEKLSKKNNFCIEVSRRIQSCTFKFGLVPSEKSLEKTQILGKEPLGLQSRANSLDMDSM
jgi:hypothetical protein